MSTSVSVSQYTQYNKLSLTHTLPPIHPTPRLYVRVMWIHTLPLVTWEAVTGVDGHPDEGYYYTRWLTGLWSTQTKVEGIMLKAA